jgi:hypothetical protein
MNTKLILIVYLINPTPNTNSLTIIDDFLAVDRATRAMKTNPFH